MRPDRRFFLFYDLAAAALVIITALRSWIVPFSHDEVATFYFYIQPGKFIPFFSHIDANGHFLTSALGWICFELFGSSPFSLRMPSLASLLLLLFAVRRLTMIFSSPAMATTFAASFMLFYTFLAYFSLARGYCISMACLLMAIFYFFRFLEHNRAGHFLKFSLFIQLALAANLTLIVVTMFMVAVSMFFYYRKGSLFRPKVLLVYMAHGAGIAFWASYAFYLRDHGALYYGAGDSYWTVTFISLSRNLFPGSGLMPEIFLGLFICMTVSWIWLLYARPMEFFVSAAFWSYVLFAGLVAGFFLLKLVAGVNYPEDRTGLFFYVFFVCSFCLLADRVFRRRYALIPMAVVIAGGLLSFRQFDLRNHPWAIYETMPAEFYEILVKEQENAAHRITVGGHRIREFIYGFQNYRSRLKLNHMTSPEALQMNCDYALAVEKDKPWYREYYDELATEDKWGFRLLKRKTPLSRKPLWEFDSLLTIRGEPEYFNCFDISDTVLASAGPLQADVTFSILNAPAPFRAWLVFQIDAENPEENVFVRVPLDLVSHDWTIQGETTFNLVTGTVPRHVKRMVLYLWNIDKTPVEMNVVRSSLSRLQGPGVNVVSKAIL